VTFTLVLIHLGVATLWLGGMAYSLFVVQPRVPRVLPEPSESEELYRELATGNRWRVAALIGVLAASGLGLVLVHNGGGERWALVIVLKVVLLAAASVLFWWVSWRGWPRRIFALPEELPAEQRRFRWVALAMAGLVGLAFLLGVVARFVS
jgi:Flp pilus assembly protein TadB